MAENHPANALFRSWFDLRVNEMRQILTCATCKTELTFPISPIETAAKMRTICTFALEKPVTPRGRYLLIEGEVRKIRMAFAKGWQPPSNAWINLDDLRDWVGYSPHQKRLSGCCDISGSGEPNRICHCGKHIGWHHADCHEWHLFEPLMDATFWKKTKDE